MTSGAAEEEWFPRLAVIGIFGGLFCGYVGLSVAIPVLPAFVRQSFGASNFEIGLTVTATALTALLIRPVSGYLADRHGYRLVMQVGAVIVAVGGVLYFLPVGLPGLIANRLLLGVGEASLFTAGAVWVVSLAHTAGAGSSSGCTASACGAGYRWARSSVPSSCGSATASSGVSALRPRWSRSR